VAFMTWGRLFEPIDESRLLKLVAEHSHSYAGSPMRKFRLCNRLRDVSKYEYFFEALLDFSWRPIPFGPKTYKRWRMAARKRLASGRDLYFLGHLAVKERR
jgi:hypothetical protein